MLDQAPFASTLRPATRADAPALADLIVLASEGLSLEVWAGMAAPGESPLEVGHRRAARDVGAFSWRHALVSEERGEVAAALIGYPLPNAPEPVPPDLPAQFVPLQELEDHATGSWYVNALATFPAHRGRGHASRLLAAAAWLARPRHLSLIASASSEGALALYRRHGFEARARRPKAGGEGDWLLLLRAV